MNPRERFRQVLDFDMNIDRLPMVEWAAWWNLTLDRWKGEGLPELGFRESQEYFGLDPMMLLRASPCMPELIQPEREGGPVICINRSYDGIRQFLYSDALIENAVLQAEELKPAHERGEIVVRIWLDGFFWFPRTLFGIEPHFYAFYDQPELMHRINSDLAAFNIRAMDAICSVINPDMIGIAEDMSYNHGPMLSKVLFDEFMLPYYRRIVPHIKKHGVKVFVDSDGDITSMVPWLIEAGADGVYPLERQAGVDLNHIRAEYPGFLMMGGYDKMTMPKGEAAMRAEFERLLPVMQSSGYIPSVDHQTPPGVSLENYKTYIRLFEEYSRKAIRGR